MSIAINREALRPGLILHQRGTSWFARLIRVALNRFMRKFCERNQIPAARVWGNHDGIFIKRGEGWFIGEALGRGNVLTPIEVYEASVSAGKEEIRVFEVVGASVMEGILAQQHWINDVCGTPYDYRAILCLGLKALFLDLSDRVAHSKVKNFCTEGVQRAWDKVTPVFQCAHAIPLTVEQVAGLLPRKPEIKTTVREITSEVIVETKRPDHC
jgi:hypothetical protein